MRTKYSCSHCIVVVMFAALLFAFEADAEKLPYSWHAPDRAARVGALIPGRKIAMPSPEEFMADWTRKQVEKWEKTHKGLAAEGAYEKYSMTNPTDLELIASIPDHISPFGRVLAGKPDPDKAARVMVSYCPFCGRGGGISLDATNPFHAMTSCCRQHLYEREQDYPPDYKFHPNSTATFVHLDNTVKEVPSYIFTDKDGVKWELFVGTTIAHKRWGQVGTRAVGFMRMYCGTGDPLYVHKLAVLLDRVADVYYGLPLSYKNELAKGKDGKTLTRAEWEALPRPVRFGYPFGRWNRRLPNYNRCWLHQGKEYIWVEPFARVRHHPVFKNYSRKKYGDPEALDRKIMTKLMREIALMFESFSLQSDYQDGAYTDLMMLGILLKNRYLFDFASAHQECVLYNHHYHDGMNGEGSPNYMGMLHWYYRYMRSGWLEFAPGFLEEHPFFESASTELKKLHTVRGLSLEFADQAIAAFDGRFITDPGQVRANEKRPSMNWPGYGIGILRVGGPGHRQEVFITYDRVSLHGASDKLGIECWVDGVPVMREGGYAIHWNRLYLDRSRPEIQTLLSLPYPRQIIEAVRRPGSDFDCWDWAHCHLAHNTASVNEIGTGRGWADNEGFGDLITYKGGEAPGEPGAGFQVLDCQDLYSFERLGVKVQEFRRALLAVEGPDGRPYVVDIFRIQGGQRHALYQSAWAETVEECLPPVSSVEETLAKYLDKIRNQPPATLPLRREYNQIRSLQVLSSAPGLWGLTWKTDYAAYVPFLDPSGKQRPRPLPENVGLVRLRLIGVRQNGNTTLLHGKGPWVAGISQGVGDGKTVGGNVGFRDAWDYLIESRTVRKAGGIEALKSVFLHILEGYREGEESAIRSVSQLALADASQAPEGAVGLKLEMDAGHTDTVVFMPESGEIRFENGLTTDARYALVRQGSKGEVVEVNMVRGTRLECGNFSVHTPGDFKGTIVDVIGDLTGTRLESALIVRPETRWPVGAGLAGRQMLIEVINHHNEAYTIEEVTRLSGGLLRVDLANHAPFSTGWYEVSFLDPDKPNRLKTNRQLWAGINTPWWWGCKAWFPELGQVYTISKTYSDRVTMDVAEKVDLKAKGVSPGDWFLIYAIEPGLKVTVPGDFAWRRKVISSSSLSSGHKVEAVCYSMRATGTATITMPAAGRRVWYRVGSSGKWQKARVRLNRRQRTMTLTFTGNETQGQVVWLLVNRPEWLNLEDSGPPEITGVLLDGKALEPKPIIELGRIPAPQKLVVEARDKNNPIDERSIVVKLDGKKIDIGSGLIKTSVAPGDRKSVSIEYDISRALDSEIRTNLPVRHTVDIAIDDFAVDQENSSILISYSTLIRVPGSAVYLSDLNETKSFVHGPLRKDTDYYDKPLRMRGVLYAKCLQTHVERGAPSCSEVIYDLSQAPGRKKFCAVVGVSDDSGGGGSVTFRVQIAKDGKWETVYSSPVLHGYEQPVAVSVDISGAKKLRLYCTDAGDGINGDHAVWCDPRLE